ncbi:hypothetical protein MTR_2g082165 [Medicago truncatula]|uniref:FPL domain-containing protein n=1 Tax=Medicago truncatula TaxID=3880 RepID=A0A072VL32_MEDTR|nr:hypothetical protein MTR_2g082165 [Medicago truncatula]
MAISNPFISNYTPCNRSAHLSSNPAGKGMTSRWHLCLLHLPRSYNLLVMFGKFEKLSLHIDFLRYFFLCFNGIVDYCFSNGYINDIISHPYKFDGVDIALHYVSFLRLFLFRFIRPENIPLEYGGLIQPTDFKNGPPQPSFKL